MKQFENFVLEKDNLGSIKDAINETIYKDEDFGKFVTVTKAKDNEPIALLGSMGTVGKKGSGCDPTYEEKGIANSMKRWKMGEWQIPIKICYESFKGTIAEYALKTGTDIGDLQGTDIMTIYTDKLEDAIKQFIWRQGWFGDEGATNVTSGGKITDETSVDLFTTCDGLFKRIFTQCAAHSNQLTAISANAQTTTAAQREAALAKGYMTDLVDKLLMDTDSRIIDDGEAVLMMTRSMADALTYDVKKSYQNIIPWDKVFDGFDIAVYNGVKVARVSIWDRMISSFEKGSKANNLPYRAVFANPNQLLVGAPDELISDLDIWFDKKERRNYIYSTGKMGTALLEEDMFHAAY